MIKEHVGAKLAQNLSFWKDLVEGLEVQLDPVLVNILSALWTLLEGGWREFF